MCGIDEAGLDLCLLVHTSREKPHHNKHPTTKIDEQVAFELTWL